VDTAEDLKLIREVYKQLYREGQIFYTEDIINLLDKHPELKAINARARQKKLIE
jgi:spore coat polysaccharide biosynthesis protein SpsF